MSKREPSITPSVILDSVASALEQGDLVAAVAALSDLAPSLQSEHDNDHKLLKRRVDKLLDLARQQRHLTKLELKKISGVNTAASRYQEIALGQ